MRNSAIGFIELRQGFTLGYAAPTMQFKDMIVDFVGQASEDSSLFRVSSTPGLDLHTIATPFQFFGCILRGGFKHLGNFFAANTKNNYATMLGCLWENVSFERKFGANTNNDVLNFAQNCNFVNISATLTAAFSLFTPQIGSCILASVGGNLGDSAFVPASAALKGDFNLYNPKGAIAGKNSVGSLPTLQDIIDSQTPAGDGVFQEHSFQLDPLFEDEAGNDYRLKSGSIAEAAGGLFPGLDIRRAADLDTNKAWEKYDFMNNLWSDNVDEFFDLFATTSVNRTRRSIGAFQSIVSGAPQPPLILFPNSVTAGQPQDMVIQGNASPQGGTIHAQVIIADSPDINDNPQFFDSVPINVTTSNNKINIKEDGGGELTATLTVGTYSTAGFIAEVKAKLDVAGAGTYTVTYDGFAGTDTRLFTIVVSGAIAATQFLWHSGTDVVNNSRILLGFKQFDTISQASNVSDSQVRENFFDPTLTWRDAPDYTPGEDPATSGTWSDIGTGDPSGSGTPNVDGADGDGNHDIRVDIPAFFGIDGKFIAARLWSGARVGAL